MLSAYRHSSDPKHSISNMIKVFKTGLSTDEGVNAVNINTALNLIKTFLLNSSYPSSPLPQSTIDQMSTALNLILSVPLPSPTPPRYRANYIDVLSHLLSILSPNYHPSPLPAKTEKLLRETTEGYGENLRQSTGEIMKDKRTTAADITKIANALHHTLSLGSSFLQKCSTHGTFSDLYYYSTSPSSITTASHILAVEKRFVPEVFHTLDAQGAFVVKNGTGENIAKGIYAMGRSKYRGSRNPKKKGKFVNAVEYNGGINKVFTSGPQHVATAVYGASQLHRDVFPLTGLFNRCTQPDIATGLVKGSSPTEAARTIWAMSLKGYDCAEYLRAVEGDAMRLVRYGDLYSISHTALGISNMNTVATDFFKYVANDTVPYFLEKGGTPAQIAMIMYSLASARCKFGDHPLLEHGFAVNELWQALLAEHVRGGEGFTTETLRFMHMTYLIARSADYYFPATPSKALAEEMAGAADTLIQRNFENVGVLKDPNIFFKKTLDVLGFEKVGEWASQDYEGKSGGRYIQELISNMVGGQNDEPKNAPFPLELAHYIHRDSQTAIQLSSLPGYCHELIPPVKGYSPNDRRENGWARVQREVSREADWSLVRFTEEMLMEGNVDAKARVKYFKARLVNEIERRYQSKVSYRN